MRPEDKNLTPLETIAHVVGRADKKNVVGTGGVAGLILYAILAGNARFDGLDRRMDRLEDRQQIHAIPRVVDPREKNTSNCGFGLEPTDPSAHTTVTVPAPIEPAPFRSRTSHNSVYRTLGRGSLFCGGVAG
jgi:hypothetical protein